MLPFETKGWFTTLLSKTLAYSAATTNLSFSPSFCHPTNPLSISPTVSLLHFFSIAPHYFAHSLSPRSSLWCSLTISLFHRRTNALLLSQTPIYCFMLILFYINMEECACECLFEIMCIRVDVCAWVQGLQRGLCLDAEDRKYRKLRRHLSSRVWACLCLSVAQGFSGRQITSWLDPDLRVPACSATNSMATEPVKR